MYISDVVQKGRFSKVGQVFLVTDAQMKDTGFYQCSASNTATSLAIKLDLGRVFVLAGTSYFVLICTTAGNEAGKLRLKGIRMYQHTIHIIFIRIIPTPVTYKHTQCSQIGLL